MNPGDVSERKYWIASEEIAAGRWVASTLTDDKPEEILISYLNPETRAQVDGVFRFYMIQDEPTPRLELFEDAWLGLHELGPEFTAMLASLDDKKLGRVATPGNVVDGLKSVGFVPAGSQNDRNPVKERKMNRRDKLNQPFRCDECGRFVSPADILAGVASHKLVTPESLLTRETFETLCREHKP